MAAPSSGQLTGAGYTLANGVYTKTFGSIVVTFNISDEPDSGVCFVVPNGDVSGTDIANVLASFSTLGYNLAGTNVTLGAAGGQTYFGMSI